MTFRIPTGFSQQALCGLVGMVCLGAGLATTLAGRTCQASCGDYVVLRGSHSRLLDADVSLHDPAPRKAPCNSPACRGKLPQLPVPQVPPSERTTEKPLALFVESLDLEKDGLHCGWLAASVQAQPGFRSPLERPPSL